MDKTIRNTRLDGDFRLDLPVRAKNKRGKIVILPAMAMEMMVEKIGIFVLYVNLDTGSRICRLAGYG